MEKMLGDNKKQSRTIPGLSGNESNNFDSNCDSSLRYSIDCNPCNRDSVFYPVPPGRNQFRIRDAAYRIAGSIPDNPYSVNASDKRTFQYIHQNIFPECTW